MIRLDQPAWLDLDTGGDAPWCSRVQVSKINSVSLVPHVVPDENNHPVIEEGVYVVRVNAEGDRHEFTHTELELAQDQYAEICRALDGDEQELH